MKIMYLHAINMQKSLVVEIFLSRRLTSMVVLGLLVIEIFSPSWNSTAWMLRYLSQDDSRMRFLLPRMPQWCSWTSFSLQWRMPLRFLRNWLSLLSSCRLCSSWISVTVFFGWWRRSHGQNFSQTGTMKLQRQNISGMFSAKVFMRSGILIFFFIIFRMWEWYPAMKKFLPTEIFDLSCKYLLLKAEKCFRGFFLFPL